MEIWGSGSFMGLECQRLKKREDREGECEQRHKEIGGHSFTDDSILGER